MKTKIPQRFIRSQFSWQEGKKRERKSETQIEKETYLLASSWVSACASAKETGVNSDAQTATTASEAKKQSIKKAE